MGEKRLYAEKLKSELSELINRRKIHSSEYQMKLKKEEHFQSTINKTRSMLQLIDDDIQFFENQSEQAKLNLQTSIADALLLSNYLAYLTIYPFDQRIFFIEEIQNSIVKEHFPIRIHFNPLEILSNPQGFIRSFSFLHLYFHFLILKRSIDIY